MGLRIQKLLKHPNIVGIDPVDKIAITIGDIPIEILEGYDVIRLHEVPHVLVDRTKKYRPLIEGVSIGHIDITAGTLGSIATYNDKPVLVSNAHVFHPEPWRETPPSRREIVQPGSYDGGSLEDVTGYYIKHVPIHLENEKSNCPVGRIWSNIYNYIAKLLGARTRLVPVVTKYNTVDVAIAKPVVNFEDKVLLNDGAKYDPDNIVGLLFAGSERDNIFIVSKASNIQEQLGIEFTRNVSDTRLKRGDIVKKCGRTTGCTEGKVLSTHMIVRVFYLVGFALFKDVIVVNGRSAGGDSGSMVWKI